MEFILHNHSSYPGLGADSAPHAANDPASTADILREQEQTGIDIVTDGQAQWQDPLSPVAGAIEGVRLGGLVRYFDTGRSVRHPVITAPLRRLRSILRDNFVSASRASRLPVKPVVTGPYTLARLSVVASGPYADVPGLAYAFSEILAAEVDDLAQAGARYIQIDEPAILFHPADIRLLRQLLEPLWSVRGGAELVVATYGSDAEPLYAQLNSLPADILALDFPNSPKLADLIAATGASKVLALGLIDGRNPRIEDVDAVARQVETILKRYVLESIHLLPSCGLQDLPRHSARAKLELLGRVRLTVQPHLEQSVR
jgi:5-methyltetrahydropteroyltriglutamate--homocysteine methyltransferase